jgi:3-phosphoshikimate 1-carboxyvinyltransferase
MMIAHPVVATPASAAGTSPVLPLRAEPAGPLRGRVAAPGDKSISHRALILGASAVGETTIAGLLEAQDVLATARALAALGARIEREPGLWRVRGRGIGGLCEPDRVLDMGNSGTGARLLMGLVASHPFISFFAGDASLSARPMRRVIEPLGEIGACVWSRTGDRLPLAIRGAPDPLPIEHTLAVASAQVKSAILLAGLNAPGLTTIHEPQPSRDHTERMLAHFGAEIACSDGKDGGRTISLVGQPELIGRELTVPGDISSAAFPLVAAILAPGSRLSIDGVGVNPLRTGLLETLAEMGANIEVANGRTLCGEPVADLVVTAGPLHGLEVPAERVPRMIDEFPILAVAAAFAAGPTRMSGLAELRVKESDRLATIAEGLAACGVATESGKDWLVVHGTGGSVAGGAEVQAHFDHRIAMAFLVLGTAARGAVGIDDGSAIATSFPEFVALMNGLGAGIGA